MRVFLTGGTGFVGSHFINDAHCSGHEIVAQRRSRESFPRVPLYRYPLWIDKPLDGLAGEDFEGCRAVVHLAAHSANVPYDTLERCIQENVLKPLVMMRAAVSAGVSRFVIAGSCFEYGVSGVRFDRIPSDAPLEPTASYPASKAAASVAFHAFAHEVGVEMLILRIFMVYGEGELESRFWPSLVRAARNGQDLPMTEGSQVRDFTPVSLVAQRFVEALERPDLAPGKPIIENVGTGRAKSLLEFASEEWNRLGATGRLLPGLVASRPNEVMRYVPSLPMESNH